MTVKTIGLDLAKDVFQVHGISVNGRVIFKSDRTGCESLLWFLVPDATQSANVVEGLRAVLRRSGAETERRATATVQAGP